MNGEKKKLRIGNNANYSQTTSFDADEAWTYDNSGFPKEHSANDTDHHMQKFNWNSTHVPINTKYQHQANVFCRLHHKEHVP